jgi:hypothetical protein
MAALLEIVGRAGCEKGACAGAATPAGSPGMLAYEPQFGSAFDFSTGQFNVAWTPFAGQPTVGITDVSGGALDTPSIGSFFGGHPTGLDFNDPGLLTSISLDGWDDVTWDPVILDLDGNGAEIRPRPDSTVYFDIDGDGAKERTAWAGPNDGLLVVDLSASGAQGPVWLSRHGHACAKFRPSAPRRKGLAPGPGASARVAA